VLGPGAERLPSRLLLGRPAWRVRGARPPVQAVHLDDLVAALALVVLHDHPGTFNVASDGWVDGDRARQLIPRPVVPPMPAQLMERVLRLTWRSGLGDVPPGVVPYLMYPWVVSNERLRSLGWEPRHTNEQAIVDGIASLGPPPSRVRTWGLAALAVVVAALLARGAVRRRRSPRGRGARRARRPTRR
jgi:UDP-glucose 4-epimerase